MQTAQDLDSRTAVAVTQAVARAEGQALTRLTAETGRMQDGLMWQVQRMEAALARHQRWLSWRMGGLLLLATVLVNGVGLVWWSQQQAAERQALQGAARLAAGLDRYLVETLYPQLTKAQQREVDAVYKAAQVPPPGPRRP